MVDILLRVFIGVAIGASTVAIYNIITKSNIAKKIKEVFFQKRATEDTIENKAENPFAAIVKEVQKDSVSVDVFFGHGDNVETEEVTVVADEVADDIAERDWISLMD